MLSNESETMEQFRIPQKIRKLLYTGFSLVAETPNYTVLEAESRDTKEKHHIRLLDAAKELKKNDCFDYDTSVARFVQELLHLQQNQPGSVLTHTFEINENGGLIACATLPTLKSHSTEEGKQVKSKRNL